MVYHLIFDISVNFDDAKKADHILKSSQDIQSFDETLFVIYKLSETEDDCQVVSSHGTLFITVEVNQKYSLFKHKNVLSKSN